MKIKKVTAIGNIYEENGAATRVCVRGELRARAPEHPSTSGIWQAVPQSIAIENGETKPIYDTDEATRRKAAYMFAEAINGHLSAEGSCVIE